MWPVWGGELAYHALDVWGEPGHFQPVSPACAACAEVPISTACSACGDTIRLGPVDWYLCTDPAGAELPEDCCSACASAYLSIDGECVNGPERYSACCDGCAGAVYDDLEGRCLTADRSAGLPDSCCDCGGEPVRTADGTCISGPMGHVLSDACCE